MTDFISASALEQFRLEAETGTALLFGGDGKRLLALFDAQRAALERLLADCCCRGKGYLLSWELGPDSLGVGCRPCRCAEARKLLETPP